MHTHARAAPCAPAATPPRPLEELLASRESNYRLAQVLFCHILTSKAEVEAFLHMAMSNPCGLAFAVMGL